MTSSSIRPANAFPKLRRSSGETAEFDVAASEAKRLRMPDVTVSKILGHALTSTTTDLYAHLRSSDASKAAVAVSVAVKQAQEEALPPTEARPKGFEPPTNRVETGRSIR